MGLKKGPIKCFSLLVVNFGYIRMPSLIQNFWIVWVAPSISN